MTLALEYREFIAVCVLVCFYLYYLIFLVRWHLKDMEKRKDRRRYLALLEFLPFIGTLIWLLIRPGGPGPYRGGEAKGKANDIKNKGYDAKHTQYRRHDNSTRRGFLFELIERAGDNSEEDRQVSANKKSRTDKDTGAKKDKRTTERKLLSDKLPVLKYIRPIELIFILFSSILIFSNIFWGTSLEWNKPSALIPAGVLTVLGIVVWLVSKDYKKGLRVIRDWLPISMALFIYENLHDITMLINPASHELTLVKIDEMLLGGQPSLWMENLNCGLMSDIMATCYVSYFILPAFIGIPLYLSESRDLRKRAFHTGFLAVILTFYLGFVGYIIYPAVSPDICRAYPILNEDGTPVLDSNGQQVYRYEYPINYTEPLAHGVFAKRVITIVYSGQAVPRDAFPSLHTAASTTCLVVAWKEKRFVFWLLLPVVAGLWFSTMYLREHYFIDVLAGWLLSAGCIWLGYKLYSLWVNRISSSLD